MEVSSQNTAAAFDSAKRLIRQEESALATTTNKTPGRHASTPLTNPSDSTDGDDFDPPESVCHKYLVHLTKTATGWRWKQQNSQLKGDAAVPPENRGLVTFAGKHPPGECITLLQARILPIKVNSKKAE